MIRAAQHEQLLDVCRRVRAEYPMIAGGLVDQHLPAGDPAWELAQKTLGYIEARSSDDLRSEIEAFATVSMDFLRLQARFMRTRRYARSDSTLLVEELYGDARKMKGYYLDGLALTYALWPNHARMITFMRDRFLPQVERHRTVVEVGVGHGLLAALMFDAVPDLHYVGVDISPAALEYTQAALDHLGVDPAARTMVEADALAGDLPRLAGEGFGALVCCEVIEHVDQPDRLLERLAEVVRPDGIGFISTVANMEADDHVYLFNDVDQIRSLFAETGWRVVEDLPNVLPGAEAWDPLPVNYSAVIAPNGRGN